MKSLCSSSSGYRGPPSKNGVPTKPSRTGRLTALVERRPSRKSICVSSRHGQGHVSGLRRGEHPLSAQRPRESRLRDRGFPPNPTEHSLDPLYPTHQAPQASHHPATPHSLQRRPFSRVFCIALVKGRVLHLGIPLPFSEHRFQHLAQRPLTPKIPWTPCHRSRNDSIAIRDGPSF